MNLSDFLRNICAVLRVKADNKQIGLLVDIDPELEQLRVLCDPTRLSQVIYNLAGNAIKFTDEGTVTVKLSIVSTSADNVEVRCAVIDTGIGIRPENHEAIFELFSQGESNILRRYGGTGLGLAIVKKILTMFNSSIQLESTPGKGSAFYFTLSLPITDQMTEQTNGDTQHNIKLDHLRMLIAEDNDLNRMIMIKQMENLGIKPVIVENGQEAVNALSAEDFDIVLMDLHMPVLDGYETIRQIRKLPDPTKANIHIVAFTASVTEQQQIFQSGFNDYLYKPVNMNDLRTKLEKIVMQAAIVA
jgi:CheY-like chemotaxis protein